MKKLMTEFRKYFSAMFLLVGTLLVGWAFSTLWEDSLAWWEHSLLVLGAAVGEIIVLAFVCCNLERRYSKEQADLPIFDSEMIRAGVTYVLCCFGLAVTMCLISASILWAVISIILMVVILFLGIMAFFSLGEVIYEP